MVEVVSENRIRKLPEEADCYFVIYCYKGFMILSKNVLKDFVCTCYCFIYSEDVSLGQVSYLVV